MFSEDQRVKLLPFCMIRNKTKMLKQHTCEPITNLMFCTSGVPVVVFWLLAMLVVMWGGCIMCPRVMWGDKRVLQCEDM